MSSKFLTWTKGDRKHATELLRSGGVISIPVECISFNGTDVSKTPKLGSISHRSSANSDIRSSSTAIALRDAAVESATSLMAVVNDLLKSPHISAHLSRRESDLQIPYGRPRSRTAPPTPRHDTTSVEPFELPGSVPAVSKQVHSAFASSSSSSPPPQDVPLPPAAAHFTERTYSSPNSIAGRFSVRPRASVDSGPISARPDDRSSSHSSTAMAMSASHDGSYSSRATSFATAMTRPPLTILQPPSMRYDMRCDDSAHQDLNATRHDSVQQDDAEATLLQQISLMRTSHDTHIKSLKYAHDQEIASHLAYIAFLERRQLNRNEHTTTQQPLTIDTSQASAMPSELPGLDVSATTSQSFDSGFDACKSISPESVAEVESLRRKLSLVRKEQAESAELLRQRDQMRDTLEQRDRRILQLKELTKRGKEIERTLRNTIGDLEARLITANNQRLDVLEGFHVACSTLEEVSKRRPRKEPAKAIPKTVPAVEVTSSTFKSSHPRSMQASPEDLRSTTLPGPSSWDADPLVAQVKNLQSMLKQKDDHIRYLEKEARNRNSTESHNADRFIELQNRLDEGQEAIKQAEQDRDRYHSLLQGEVRRQARHAARTSAISPSIAAEAAGKVQEMLDNARAIVVEGFNNAGGSDLRSVPGILEKELQHCLGEIIMYKLDVRGYRKDLKETKAHLESLQSSIAQRPLTPPRSTSRSRARLGSERQKDTGDGGLGITMSYTPITPPRSACTATAESLLAATDVSSEVSTPLHRPRTPLVIHKRLPKPPPSKPSPYLSAGKSPPMLKVSRAETTRSMSDSIISSYAQRATPELLDAGLYDYAGVAQAGKSNKSTPLMKGAS